MFFWTSLKGDWCSGKNLSVYEDKCLLALSEGALCSVIYNPGEQRAGPRDYPTDLRDVVTTGTPGECKRRESQGFNGMTP